ncbi:MAG: hypothetical protein ABSE41_12475 [Bacteroidota bacterium]|jgi:hypothetical protein
MKTIISPVFTLLLCALTGIASFTAISYAQEPRHVLGREDARYDSLMRRLMGREIDTTSSHVARQIDTIRFFRNWAMLKKGLSRDDVRKLLGSPIMIARDLEHGWIIWSYGDRNLAFNSVTGKLSQWDNLYIIWDKLQMK